MFDLVENSNCWFSHAKAQLQSVLSIYTVTYSVHNYACLDIIHIVIGIGSCEYVTGSGDNFYRTCL